MVGQVTEPFLEHLEDKGMEQRRAAQSSSAERNGQYQFPLSHRTEKLDLLGEGL